MREYVRTSHLCVGDETSETLYDDKMRVLLQPGNTLTARGIDAVERLGYKGIYIENNDKARREDIPLSEPFLDNETMMRMVADAKDALKKVIDDNSHISEFVRVMSTYVDDLVKIMRKRQAENNLIYEVEDMRISSNWIFYHSIVACVLSAGIAMVFGFTDEKVKDIALGGLLHDMGKAILGGNLYQKEDITEDERKTLRQHPEKLFRLLQRETALPVDTTYAVWQHHEKCDGSGYPLGIRQDKIYLSAQIVALASAYDNLVNITPYKPDAMSGAEAYEYIAGCGLYSVECINALRSFAAIYRVGAKVQLSDEKPAVVLKNIPGIPERPYLLRCAEVLDLAHDEKRMALVIEKEIM